MDGGADLELGLRQAWGVGVLTAEPQACSPVLFSLILWSSVSPRISNIWTVAFIIPLYVLVLSTAVRKQLRIFWNYNYDIRENLKRLKEMYIIQKGT